MWTLKLRGRNGMQSCTTCSGSSTVQTLKGTHIVLFLPTEKKEKVLMLFVEEIGALFAWDPLTVQSMYMQNSGIY